MNEKVQSSFMKPLNEAHTEPQETSRAEPPRVCHYVAPGCGDRHACGNTGASSTIIPGGVTCPGCLPFTASWAESAQVIPKERERTVRLPRSVFADAVRAVSLSAEDRTGGVKISLAKGLLRISACSVEKGEAYDEIAVDYSGDNLSIGVNARYVSDALGALEEEEIELDLCGELDPIVLRPVGAQQFLAVVMPMCT
jgi:hypothetical protein